MQKEMEKYDWDFAQKYEAENKLERLRSYSLFLGKWDARERKPDANKYNEGIQRREERKIQKHRAMKMFYLGQTEKKIMPRICTVSIATLSGNIIPSGEDKIKLEIR